MEAPTGTAKPSERAAGLTWAAAQERRRADGPNELARAKPLSALRLFADQFTSPLVLLLLGAAAVAAFVGALLDAGAIVMIVTINAVVGFNQEHRAQRETLALRSLTAARARVVREGHLAELPASDVVVGDLLVLEAGDVVAADGALTDANELQTVEAALTGESLPVEKRIDQSPHDAALAEQHDKVFMGTSVAAGTGKAVVEATGMRTQMGKIASLLAEARDGPTPLQKRLAGLGRTLIAICVLVVALLAVVGLARGVAWMEMLLTSVSLAVAAVPEGLPAVVTVALAVGLRRMSAKQVLIRRLSAVETLGSATVICTDKTGTLTTGKMSVQELEGPDRALLLRVAAACTDADLGGGQAAAGDPTEIAILEAAREHGVERQDIERTNPRVSVRPFDPQRRRMSILRADGRLYVKGAPEEIIARCATGTAQASANNEAMAAQGLRVLAVALGHGPEERDLQWLGLIGIADTERPEAVEAIGQAKRAGVRVVMITGDHPLTATHVARKMGIVEPGQSPDGCVFARKTAADKTKIVAELRRRGEVVAMTGDGVNDAPSIRESDIGVAMGQTATEVTREASDLILTDDNLIGVVDAIREGRTIYENIRKTVVYLLGGNAAELLFMLAAGLVGLPLPLTPLQLLWVNMMNEPLPGLALAVDPVEQDVLADPPRPTSEPILRLLDWARIGAVAVLHSVVVLGVFVWALEAHGLEYARSVTFTTFVLGVLFRSFAARSATRTFFRVGATGNAMLLAIITASVGLQIVIQLIPFTQKLFGLTPWAPEQFLLAFGLGLVPVTVVEVAKIIRGAVAGQRKACA